MSIYMCIVFMGEEHITLFKNIIDQNLLTKNCCHDLYYKLGFPVA